MINNNKKRITPLKLIKSRISKNNINSINSRSNLKKSGVRKYELKKNLFYQPIYDSLLTEEIKPQFDVKLGSLSKVEDEICEVNTRAFIKDADLKAFYNLYMNELVNDYEFIIKYRNNEILESWVDTFYPILDKDEKVDIIFRKKLGGIITMVDLQSISNNTTLIKRNPITTGILKSDFLPISQNTNRIIGRAGPVNPITQPTIEDNIIQLTINQGEPIQNGSLITIQNPIFNYQQEMVKTNWFSHINEEKKYYALTIRSGHYFSYEIINNDNKSYKIQLNDSSASKFIEEDVGIIFDNKDSIFSLIMKKDYLIEYSNEDLIEFDYYEVTYEEYYNHMYSYNFILNGEMFQTRDGGETYTSKMSFKNTDKIFAYKIDKTVNEVRAGDEFFITFSHDSKNISVHELVKNILIYDITNCI